MSENCAALLLTLWYICCTNRFWYSGVSSERIVGIWFAQPTTHWGGSANSGGRGSPGPPPRRPRPNTRFRFLV